MEYIQPNITISNTVEIIKDKIHNEIPFSLTRFGDGEIHIIKNTGSIDFQKRVCDEWGYSFPSQLELAYSEIRKVLIESLIKSDIIGFMDKNTPTLPNNFFNPNDWSLEKTKLIDLGIDLKSVLICDHMIARSKEVGDINNFKKILNGKDLHIISPNKTKLESNNLSKILECNVSITNHPNTLNISNREKFIQDLSKIKEPVVVYGTSILKDYGVYLRDNFGKVTLDLGATLDAWANIVSRSWFNHKQNYLLIKNK
jgi:hypothetical protein